MQAGSSPHKSNMTHPLDAHWDAHVEHAGAMRPITGELPQTGEFRVLLTPPGFSPGYILDEEGAWGQDGVVSVAACNTREEAALLAGLLTPYLIKVDGALTGAVDLRGLPHHEAALKAELASAMGRWSVVTSPFQKGDEIPVAPKGRQIVGRCRFSAFVSVRTRPSPAQPSL